MDDLKSNLTKLLKGRVSTSKNTLTKYSHDASIFEIEPALIVFPKDKHDISALVSYIRENKTKHPNLSLTPRSGGTDMSGGAVNDSIIVSFETTFKKISHLTRDSIRVEPGVYYRDLEKLTRRHNLLMPAYPASRAICMVGGMTANNAGGEKSLTYGKVIDYVISLKVILRDGNEYMFEPLDQTQLRRKLALRNLEGELYREIFQLVDKNFSAIKAAKPKVHKNSTGYNIWDVWDKQTFDMTKLFVGSQGTLGIITQTEFRLVPVKPLSGLLIVFMPSLDHLGEIINTVLETKPSSFESFDDHTLNFSFHFFPYFLHTLGLKGFLSLALGLLSDIRYFIPHLPKLILLVEYEGDTQQEIDQKLAELQQKISRFSFPTKITPTATESKKYWILRRESFNVLRHNVQGAHTAPFIDDFVVPPQHLPEFFPKLKEILDKNELLYTIAGHLGDGNFHIIPLMKLQQREERNKIKPVMEKVNNLVVHYGGSISGEHNDGLIRGPFLDHMYSPELIRYFKEIKKIFDPDAIFNPHKKMNADWDFSSHHIKTTYK